ncbi:MAG: Histidine kinase [Thermotoga sp. 47_83]|uniref:histidine kinase n=1 Tax=Thermotoga petrophila TaxID=93929 RepID=A0A117L2Y9_9THEM|nr:MAG: Histidine kinase [Thermotoga petrophila]KUK33788.1 MAG: Histidine kinase [Thermotoga sp. 47_83]MBZ4661104.1 histidine kinase [Thermotoga sp.]MDK2898214.1 two-component system, OmpR family, sensor kinase [Thermotoga sp.]
MEETKEIKEQNNRLFLLLSIMIMEFSNAKTENDILQGLLNLVKKVVDIKEVVLVDENKRKIWGRDIDIKRFEEFIDWSIRQSNPVFVEDEFGYVGIVPVVKQDRMFGSLIVLLNHQPSMEETEIFKVLSFLSAIVLENIKLYRELEETYNYVNVILNGLPEGIFVYSNGEIKFQNEKFKEENFPDEVLKKAISLSEEAISLRTQRVGEVISGEEFFSITSIPLALGSEIQALTIVENVTESKELERLKRIDRMKTEFIANISHELRTPLTAIKAYAETVYNSLEELDLSTLKEFLEVIIDQSNHLENLLNELLDFSRLERKSLQINREKVDLCDLVESAVNAIKEFALSHNVKVSFESNVSCPVEAHVDPTRIKQVLLNLLNNGVKYSKKDAPDKYVKVILDEKDGGVLIIVEDNGIGIPDHAKDRIFEQFYRVDSSLTYEVPGTGLGLAITKEIVELHGGRIWVESEVGKGSRFFVWIPKDRAGEDNRQDN